MRRRPRSRRAFATLVLCLPLAAAICASDATSAQGYLTSTGSGSAHAAIATLHAPGSAKAAVTEAGVRVTWKPSTISAGNYATSYTVARYSSAGIYLAQATCGTVLATGEETSASTIECTDEPGPGSFEYAITARYRSWTATPVQTEAATFYTSSTTLASSADPTTPNSPVTYAATVEVAPSGTPGGAVRFTEAGTTIGECAEVRLTATAPYRATCDVEYAATGSHLVVAEYLGDGTHPSSSSAALSEEVANPPNGPLTALAPASVPSGAGPARVVVSPDGKNVYVTNRSEGTVSQYARNLTTGALIALSTPTVASGAKPEGIAVTPNGEYVYVANLGSNSVSEYSRNATTGALAPLATASAPAESEPIGVAVSPNGENVYVAESESEEVSEYKIDAETGELTPLATGTLGAEANAHGVAVSPDGNSVYVSNYGSGTVSMYSVGSEGALSSVGTVKAGTNPHDLVVSPDGTSVYVADNASAGAVQVFSRNLTSGALTFIASVPAGKYSECVAVSPDGEDVYVTNEISGTVSQYARAAEDGALTALAPTYVGSGELPEGIAISPDGKSVYVANSGSSSISQYER